MKTTELKLQKSVDVLLAIKPPIVDGALFSLPYISMHAIGWKGNKRANNRKFN